MAITRWRPTRGVFSVRDEINRLFDDLLSEEPEMSALREGAWSPSVDISETEDQIVVEAELSGIDQKDLKVNVQDNVLTIGGEKTREKEKKGTNYHRVERAYGAFHRSFSLPSEVDSEKTEASYRDGVLTIRMPKTEKAKPKEITIEAK